MAPLLVLLMLAQYPPEGQPIRPSIPILFMIVPAPAADLPPAPPGQPVKLLWVFPANTATGQAQATSRCAAALPQNNLVYGNDPANPTRFQLVGCVYYPAYTSGTMAVDLNWLQTDYVQNGPIKQLRDALHADLVQMASADTGACGLGYLKAGVYGKQWGYSVVQWSCTNFGQFSDSHEMGHNFGLEHDPPNANGDIGITPYAFGFCDSAHGKRDPMVYPGPCGGSRVPYFGNVNISPFGYPWGDATSDGARVLRDQMPRVANFYPPVSGHRPSIITSLTAFQ